MRDHPLAVDVDQPHLVEARLVAQRGGLDRHRHDVVGVLDRLGLAAGGVAVEGGEGGGRQHGAGGLGLDGSGLGGADRQASDAQAGDQGGHRGDGRPARGVRRHDGGRPARPGRLSGRGRWPRARTRPRRRRAVPAPRPSPASAARRRVRPGRPRRQHGGCRPARRRWPTQLGHVSDVLPHGSGHVVGLDDERSEVVDISVSHGAPPRACGGAGSGHDAGGSSPSRAGDRWMLAMSAWVRSCQKASRRMVRRGSPISSTAWRTTSRSGSMTSSDAAHLVGWGHRRRRPRRDGVAGPGGAGVGDLVPGDAEQPGREACSGSVSSSRGCATRRRRPAG